MCGRFALSNEINELITDFVAQGGDFRDWEPSWNIAPTDTVPVLVSTVPKDVPKDEDGVRRGEPVRRLEPARWSLVPSWAKEPKLKFPTFNARSEDLAAKASWKGPLASKRAIVPASGYYEWHTDEDGRKTPFYIHLPGDELIGMAGLYSWWADPTKDRDDSSRWLLSVAILTSDAVDALIGIHDRNPVPLPRELWDWWMDPTVTGDQDMADRAVEASLPVAEALEVRQVAPIKRGADGPQLIAPVEE
ncbi:SOS response-associated peptidase [Agromyces archimandritae]|uniref:Abasic site processing protein n=1 Tax=Agromyces archimandritae TaxID=2781962 RepID=A0A975FKX7_9MICO|nr:SOS response-associated peptidase [Agromyces archimandritae]QTX03647.1 SOS response-associated peptidase [Agromyces archimandritae]